MDCGKSRNRLRMAVFAGFADARGLNERFGLTRVGIVTGSALPLSHGGVNDLALEFFFLVALDAELETVGFQAKGVGGVFLRLMAGITCAIFHGL